MSSLEKNKALARKADLLWSSDNLEEADEIYAKNCINHPEHVHERSQILRGVESWKNLIKSFREAFPDYQDTITHQIAEGDKVVTCYSSKGTHKGHFMGIAPTNKTTTWTGICVDRMENGKIVETWGSWDLYGLLDRLGVITVHK
jgi:predicted ester cyclase